LLHNIISAKAEISFLVIKIASYFDKKGIAKNENKQKSM